MKKLISTLMIIALMFVMVGCNNTDNISIQKINDTITKVQTVVAKLETIPEQNLFIDDIMDKDTNYSSMDDEEGTGYNGSTFTSGTKQIDNYFSKIYNLSQTAQNVVYLNNDTSFLKTCINSKTNSLFNMCNLFNEKQCNFDDSQATTINDICNNIVLNANRVALSRDEIQTQTSNVVMLKRNYSSNIDKLNLNYKKLVNCIQTRNNYLNSICNGFDNIYEMMVTYLSPNYSKKTNNSNVDTYNKSNPKQIENRVYDNENNYPYENEVGFGHGGTNPFYRYGGFGGGMGFGGYGRYPYSPYSNYNPYVPNIDTFGSYTNVDTYKSYEENDNEKEIKENDISYPYRNHSYMQPRTRYPLNNLTEKRFDSFKENLDNNDNIDNIEDVDNKDEVEDEEKQQDENNEQISHVVHEDEKTQFEKLKGRKKRRKD